MSVTGLVPRALRRQGLDVIDLLCGVALIGLAVLAMGDAWTDMLTVAWRDEESSHALLVPIVVVWLVWVRRARYRHCFVRNQWVGVLVALTGAAVSIIGDSFLWQSVWHFGAILGVVGALITVLGTDVPKEFFPAFLVLLFLIPVPGRIRQRISLPLQEATAAVTQEACQLTGVEVERNGSLLRLNGVDVAVGEACNGMRMTFALFLVCFAFAFTTPLQPYVRLTVLLLSPFSAIVCNVVRLIPTVLVYGNFDGVTAQKFHDISGWVMLMIAFAFLMSTISLLRWLALPIAPFRFAHD